MASLILGVKSYSIPDEDTGEISEIRKCVVLPDMLNPRKGERGRLPAEMPILNETYHELADKCPCLADIEYSPVGRKGQLMISKMSILQSNVRIVVQAPQAVAPRAATA